MKHQINKAHSPKMINSQKQSKQKGNCDENNNVQYFFHLLDKRTKQQKDHQSKTAIEICHNNFKTFNVILTDKKRIPYQPSTLIKISFDNGWYAMITDNEVKSDITVMTVHGAPGDHRQWAGLQTQMDKSIRWINFVIPGFDGFDERRGKYSGSVQDLSQLIMMVLQQRKVEKIIYCGYSMGTIFGSYFISKNPHIVCGFVNISGITNYWFLGQMVYYKTILVQNGFGNTNLKQKLIQNLKYDQFRNKLHQKFIQDCSQITFKWNVPFAQYKVAELCAYIKLNATIQSGGSQFFELNRQNKMLKLLIYGEDDQFHTSGRLFQQIYSLNFGQQNFAEKPENKKLLRQAKHQLEITLQKKLGIKIIAQQLQKYFCFYFPQTKHSAHKRRPKEISQILKVYILLIQILEKYRISYEPKL